jgi:hypothetical protein
MVTGRKFLIIFKNALKKAISEKGKGIYGVWVKPTPPYMPPFPAGGCFFSKLID